MGGSSRRSRSVPYGDGDGRTLSAGCPASCRALPCHPCVPSCSCQGLGARPAAASSPLSLFPRPSRRSRTPGHVPRRHMATWQHNACVTGASYETRDGSTRNACRATLYLASCSSCEHAHDHERAHLMPPPAAVPPADGWIPARAWEGSSVTRHRRRAPRRLDPDRSRSLMVARVTYTRALLACYS